jgi:hypothetical protein
MSDKKTRTLVHPQLSPSSLQCAHPCIPENHKFVINGIVIIPHPAYSLDLTSCNVTLFPKLKMKLKGCHFEAVSDIQIESQAVLHSIKENWGGGEISEIAAYSSKETILKEMAAKIE